MKRVVIKKYFINFLKVKVLCFKIENMFFDWINWKFKVLFNYLCEDYGFEVN